MKTYIEDKILSCSNKIEIIGLLYNGYILKVVTDDIEFFKFRNNDLLVSSKGEKKWKSIQQVYLFTTKFNDASIYLLKETSDIIQLVDD